jgi:hypothetical protein
VSDNSQEFNETQVQTMWGLGDRVTATPSVKSMGSVSLANETMIHQYSK